MSWAGDKDNYCQVVGFMCFLSEVNHLCRKKAVFTHHCNIRNQKLTEGVSYVNYYVATTSIQ